MRESEAQTIPASFGVVKQDNTFQEIFELKDFHYGAGLPVEMHDIELIAKAREKKEGILRREVPSWYSGVAASAAGGQLCV